MQLLLLDPRWPTQIPLDMLSALSAPLSFSEEITQELQRLLLGMPLAAGEGTFITTDEEQAQNWKGEVLTVPSLEDPVHRAVTVMHRARQIGEFERSMTHSTLLPYLWSETQEFADQVAAWESDHEEAPLKAELGDILLQVFFHSELAAEREAFTFFDVAQSFLDKLHSRAPYLFDGSTGIIDEATQDRLWQAGKRREHNNRYTGAL